MIKNCEEIFKTYSKVKEKFIKNLSKLIKNRL